jgi:hypothetical protein
MELVMLTDQQALQISDAAAEELYRAELALHDAHQSHVDRWINAADEHLHRAIAHYLAVQAELGERHTGPGG